MQSVYVVTARCSSIVQQSAQGMCSKSSSLHCMCALAGARVGCIMFKAATVLAEAFQCRFAQYSFLIIIHMLFAWSVHRVKEKVQLVMMTEMMMMLMVRKLFDCDVLIDFHIIVIMYCYYK